jgi:hypothetical protein
VTGQEEYAEVAADRCDCGVQRLGDVDAVTTREGIRHTATECKTEPDAMAEAARRIEAKRDGFGALKTTDPATAATAMTLMDGLDLALDIVRAVRFDQLLDPGAGETVTADLEEGRRLASQRDDLIAQGVNPADLAVPIAPHCLVEGCVRTDVHPVGQCRGRDS